jgi:hypothetical protein
MKIVTCAGALLITAALWAIAGGPFMPVPAAAAPALSDDLIYALTVGNHLVHFRSATPGTILGNVSVTGLQSGETLLAIDFRPNTHELYGLGSTSRLYHINKATGVATQVGSGPFTPALSGAEFAFDFNPVVDRVRVVSDMDQNLRLSPSLGTVVGTDIPVAFAPADVHSGDNAQIGGLAYSNNVLSPTVTTLYGYEYMHNALVTQGGPNGTPSSNGGLIFTIGSSGVTACNTLIGLDIASSGQAYASLNTGACTTSGLYTVNLATGAATLVGSIGGGVLIRDIAVELEYILYLPLVKR